MYTVPATGCDPLDWDMEPASTTPRIGVHHSCTVSTALATAGANTNCSTPSVEGRARHNTALTDLCYSPAGGDVTLDCDNDHNKGDTRSQGYKDGVPLAVWELEDLLYGFLTPWDELSMLWSSFDDTGFGELSPSRFRSALYDAEFRRNLRHLAGQEALGRLEQRSALHRAVTYQEFVDLVSNKRRRSFSVAVHQRDRLVASPSGRCCDEDDDYAGAELRRLPRCGARLLYRLAAMFAPGATHAQRKYYALQYACWPPPLFIPALTLVQMLLFVYCTISPKLAEGGTRTENDSLLQQFALMRAYDVPVDSPLIFSADRRLEVWRYITYALVHAGWWHLCFNMVIQTLCGIPLEMVHGSVRVLLIYVAGVFASSLAMAIMDPHAYLVGASGAVYALLTAHVANVMLNFRQFDCGVAWLLIFILVASFDFSLAIWDRYSRDDPSDHPTSYLSHVVGAFTGLTLGLAVLRRTQPPPRHAGRKGAKCGDGGGEKAAEGMAAALVWWVAVGLFVIGLGGAIVGNVLGALP